MKGPMTYIDRFCTKHPNFGIPNLMLVVCVANVAVWLLGMVNSTLLSYMSFDADLILRGQVWRLITFAFFPPSTGILALIAIYFYYLIGNTLERLWGRAKFNVYFFSGILMTLLYGILIHLITNRPVRLNANYVYLSMFFSFAVFLPDMQVMLFFIFPVKMKWLALVDALFFALSVIRTPFPMNLLPIVAMLNFFVFCWRELMLLIPSRERSGAVRFRRESARIRREQRRELYKHKCAVCGRTDTDYPNLEFRYCSRCAGYHCFCQDHINSHIHFTE